MSEVTSPLRRSSRTPVSTVHYTSTPSGRQATERKNQRNESETIRKRKTTAADSEHSKNSKIFHQTEPSSTEEEEVGPRSSASTSLATKEESLEELNDSSVQNPEVLPSIYDTAALEAFFQKSRRISLRSTILAQMSDDPSTAAFLDECSKSIIDANGKEITVKEALAMNFRNYRVRIPKRKYAELTDISRPSTATSFPVSHPRESTPLSNGSDEQAAHEANTFSFQEFINSFAPNHENQITTTAGESECQTVNFEDFLRNISEFANNTRGRFVPMLPDKCKNDVEKGGLVSISSYPFSAFWKLNFDVSKGNKGVYYIKGVKYVMISTLIHHGSFAVSLEEMLRFQCSGCLLEMNLLELLLAHGIVIDDPRSCRELQAVFNSSVFLVHHAIAEQLSSDFSALKANKESAPISLSTDIPPFACYNLTYFKTFIGKQLGSSFIFDSTNDNATDDCQLGVDVKPLPLNCHLSVRDRAMLVTSFEMGKSLGEISEKYNITPENVKKILSRREDVVRDQVTVYLTEAAAERDREASIPPSSSEELRRFIKRKSRHIRRTSYAGLNMITWRFFRDCRDSGIAINGKLLKEQAMMFAQVLGLDSFKGSEGWLDAFKRRHKIDLKMMTGSAVNYEEGDDEENEDDERRPSTSDHVVGVGDYSISSQMYASGEGITAALLGCVEKASGATASIGNTQPLDINHLLEGQTGIDCVKGPSGFSQSSLFENSAMTHDERGLIADVVKSTLIRISDNQVTCALDTLRAYILKHDPSIIGSLVDLQVKLAAIMAEPNRDNAI